MFSNRKRSFGEFLVEKGVITDEQLKQVLDYKGEHGELKIGEILQKLGLLEKESVLKYLGEYLDMKSVLVNRITMPQDLKSVFSMEFMKTNNFAPFECDGEKLKIAIEDVYNLELISDIDIIASRKKYKTEYYISMKEMIKEFIDFSYSNNTYNKFDVSNFADHIIEEGIRRNSSDIHIEPISRERIRVRYRVDGYLSLSNFTVSNQEYETVSTKLKVMANLNTAEKRRSQDGHILEYKAKSGKVIDIRVSTILAEYGEKIVLRLLNKNDKIRGLRELGFDDNQISIIVNKIKSKSGAIYMAGSTGSGKTSTLYTLLDILNKTSLNIVTIENPIEKTLEGLNQVNVNEAIGTTFYNTLRTVLRQDPDIIMVGEIRDKETFSTAVEASMTGHLVLTTLHANSAVKVIDRVNALGIDSYNFSTSLLLVVFQKLVRRLCPHCKQKYTPSETERKYIEKVLKTTLEENVTIYRSSECDKCNRGYIGREVVSELFENDENIERMLLERKSSTQIREYLDSKGYATASQQAMRKVLEGTISIDEAKIVVTE